MYQGHLQIRRNQILQESEKTAVPLYFLKLKNNYYKIEYSGSEC